MTMTNSIQNLASFILAREDASGAYDPAHLAKMASIVTGLLGAGGSALARAKAGGVHGWGDMLAPAVGGYVAGDRFGLGGALAGSAAEYGAGEQEQDPSSPVSKFVNSLTKDEKARHMIWQGLRATAPVAAGKAVDWASNLYKD